jgi:hypothetical protein
MESEFILNRISLIFLLFISVQITQANTFYQAETDTLISNDSMNLAILEMDYLTNQFIRASVLHYPMCTTCDQDSLPFLGEYTAPMDFGDMKFYYTFNNQMLFWGSLVWMGTGQINYPTAFAPASSFPATGEFVPLPANRQYLYWSVFPSMGGLQYFKDKSDTMWAEIAELQLVHQFAAGNHMRVGFFGYAPTQGLFDPNQARWIIFLYRGTFTSQVPELNGELIKVDVFPNPASDKLQIRVRGNQHSGLKLFVYDISGRQCLEQNLQGSTSNEINIKDLKSGIYQYKIEGEGFVKNAKFVKQ